MKKLLIAVLWIGLTVVSLSAELRYDAVGNYFYSFPKTADVNISEYNILVVQCGIIINRIDALLIAAGKKGNTKIYSKQVFEYLKQIGTPTALRLLKDLKKNPSIEKILNI